MPSVVVLGAGGHAKVLIDTLHVQGAPILGFMNVKRDPDSLLGIPYLGNDDVILTYSPKDTLLVNGLGSVGNPSPRIALYEKFRDSGYRYYNVVHPTATVSRYVELGEGIQVMAGAVIQPGVYLGENSMINTRASVDHDCHIGAHVHIAPGALVCGGVTIGDRTHIGSGAIIIQGIRIGSDCMVAAGAVVVTDVPDKTTVMGVPARRMIR